MGHFNGPGNIRELIGTSGFRYVSSCAEQIYISRNKLITSADSSGVK